MSKLKSILTTAEKSKRNIKLPTHFKVGKYKSFHIWKCMLKFDLKVTLERD